MASKTETRIVSATIKAIKTRFPTFIVWKLSDRFSRGLPDILVIGRNALTYHVMAVGIEVKTATGKQSALQAHIENQFRMLDADGIKYFVVHSPKEAIGKLEDVYYSLGQAA